jgi:hypothetical protein
LSEAELSFVLTGAGEFENSDELVTALPSPGSASNRWTTAESLRLARCLLEPCIDAGGITYLSFFREGRSRANLNLSGEHVLIKLAELYNDRQRTSSWRTQHAQIEALARFNIDTVPSRSPKELRDKFSLVYKEVNDWHSSFTKSGGAGLEYWDWTVHPVAELIMKIDPPAIQVICTGMVAEDGLPAVLDTEVRACYGVHATIVVLLTCFL